MFERDTVFSHPALPHYVSELFSPAMAAGAHSYEREYTIVHGSLVAIKVQLKVTVQPLVGDVGGPRPRGSAGQVDTLSPELLHLLGLGFAASVGGAGVGGAAGTPSEAVPQTPGTRRPQGPPAGTSCPTRPPAPGTFRPQGPPPGTARPTRPHIRHWSELSPEEQERFRGLSGGHNTPPGEPRGAGSSSSSSEEPAAKRPRDH